MYELLSNVPVTVEVVTVSNDGNLTLYPRISVDGGRYQHDFESDSAENHMLVSQGKDILEAHLSGGHFFFVDGKLADYRPSSYRGFIRDDEGIKRMVEHLGIERYSHRTSVRGAYVTSSIITKNQTLLGGSLSRFEMDVRSLGPNNVFDIGINGSWSPFSPNMNTTLEVERLVCENGMVATSEWVTRSVPMVYDWDNSLRLVTQRLEPEVQGIISKRFNEMSKTCASIHDITKAIELISSRGESDADLQTLERMLAYLNLETNLAGVYKPEALHMKEARHLDSHVTQFALMNVLTETMRHVDPGHSSDAAVNRLVNKVVFDDYARKSSSHRGMSSLAQKIDADPRTAFYGRT